MKRFLAILSFIILLKSDTFISIDEQNKNWFNSLEEGTYNDGDSSTIIKKNKSGNVIITSIVETSFCSMEYDSTGSLVMQWTGTILSE